MLENPKDISSIKLTIASPEAIMAHSWGEVFNPVGSDVKTNKPNFNGLFCPKIFGPVNANECLCEEPTFDRTWICEVCGVDLSITNHDVRSRFGHISLAVPVVHPLFYKSDPNVIAILLDKTDGFIEDLTNCNLHVVIESSSDELDSDQIITTDMYRELWGSKSKILTGGTALSYLLSKINLKMIKQSMLEMNRSVLSEDVLEGVNKRLEIVNGLIDGDIQPDLLMIRILSVLPAGLRPMVILDEDKLVSSDLNELYKQVIIGNNIVSLMLDEIEDGSDVDFDDYLIALRDLQLVVNALIDNSSGADKPMHYNVGALKSLTESLKGKRGMFRSNILGKRVDYSGRSVIVPGPDLLLNECEIPRVMALELFDPFVCSKLMLRRGIETESEAKYILKHDRTLANEILDEVVKYCPVLLNRAPTLHKLNIRAFWIKLTNERVIRLHPLLCSGYNADFDGDQMAVHVPLSFQAKMECSLLMMADKHVFHPAHGDPCILPTKDMILGLHYMSLTSNVEKNICLQSFSQVHRLLESGIVGLHDKVKFITKGGSVNTITSTPGRLLISEAVPVKCRFLYEWSFPNLSKQMVSDLVGLVRKHYNSQVMVLFCEHLMALGFKYSTRSGLSLSMVDFDVPSIKNSLIKKMRTVVTSTWPNLFRGDNKQSNVSTNNRQSFWSIWPKLLRDIHSGIESELHCKESKRVGIKLMLDSGARGTWSQVKQLAGAKGDIIGLDNQRCGIPILNSYSEGLSLIQFFCCSFSSRRGLADTSLNTASSGYLTRKLVEVTRECVIGKSDCRTTFGLKVMLVIEKDFIKNRLIGRTLMKPIHSNGIIITKANELITDDNIRTILDHCGNDLWIRSPLTCQSKTGCCKLCYGIDLGSRRIVKDGGSVGILAAQSISEPGTQLTLRTFHGKHDSKEDTGVEGIRGCLSAPLSGVVRLTNISCVCFRSEITVVGTKCRLAIEQDNMEVWGLVLKRGTTLLVTNNTNVSVGSILCFNNMVDGRCISLASGIIKLRNLIYGINVVKVMEGGLTMAGRDINSIEFNKGRSSSVCLDVGGGLILDHFVPSEIKINLLVHSSKKVNVFDVLSEVRDNRQDSIVSDEGEAFTKLSRMFEGNIEENDCVVLANTDGCFKYGNKKPNDNVFVLDPSSSTKRPLVYHLQQNVAVVEDNKRVTKGASIVLGEPSLQEYIDVYGFDRFFNYFINTVQEIYESQGVSVNSKHIEVVLKQMVDIGYVLESGDLPIPVGKNLKWCELSKINSIATTLGMKPAVFVRKIIGINEICLNWTSALSAISFHGSTRSITKATISGKPCDVSGIKDSIILGKLPPFGTGFRYNFIKMLCLINDRIKTSSQQILRSS
ncbi:DNA-directed RNA polymerase subunit beta' [Candidatus Hodgkinia cicadicola]|uniref:DNA-directed RNA polymerase subunit n=1 Tax=Candidatus Hodgkinia cicadicola TaxID=573658 RepID=A0ABX4MES2_9HYPH|nr:DNA-directed RNA polymerase subunit beta' [Candidatus Hodgkinia cicadicola]